MRSDDEIVAELEKATDESDYPFDVTRWDRSIEISPQLLRETAGQTEAPVAVMSTGEFFSSAMPEVS